MPKIFISPSDQTSNKYCIGGTNEGAECHEIAAYLEDMLVNGGYEVLNYDTYGKTLAEIVAASNAYKPDMHLALHTNAFNRKVGGTRVFYYSTESKGYPMAMAIYKRVAPASPGTSDNITQHPGLYEVGQPDAPSVYLEIAFHDNMEDCQWIINNKDVIADLIYRGICDYFETPVLDNSGVLYRVQTGAFRVLDNAKRLAEKMRAQGYETYIVKVEDKNG